MNRRERQRPLAARPPRRRPARRTRPRRTPWRCSPPEAGSATVELVIATPLVALLLLLVVQFGVWAHAAHIAQAAANQGLQTARAYRSSAAAGQADTRALLDQSAGSLLSDRTVTVTRTATTVTVTVTGRAAMVVPGLRLPVRVTVTGPVERLLAKSRQHSTVDGGGRGVGT
jgi:Flp pilus assembly protein TadG